MDLLDQDISLSLDLADRQLQVGHRQGYTALIDRLNTIIAPHKCLPAELLADIFYLTLPYNFQIGIPYRRFNYGTEQVLPLSFGHICSSWRQVALTDHRLWNRIQICVKHVKPFTRQLLETILLRSGSAPIEILMIVQDCSFMSVSDTVLPHAGRISRLHLFADPRGFCSFFCSFSVLGHTRHTLSSLTEVILTGDHLEIPDVAIRIFGDHPLLRKLTIDYQPELWKTLRGLHAPFSQLTDLTLNVHSSPPSILSVLKETVNLVRCHINFCHSSFADDPAFGLVLPHLENLNLFSYSVEILIQVLQHMTLPSLRQLYAGDPSIYVAVPDALPSVVLSLINRSSCHLAHIQMKGNLWPIIERSHRSLVSIDTALSALPASMAQRIACRELTLPHLKYLCCTLDLDTFTDLKNMVDALWLDGEGAHGAAVRRMLCCRCNIASVSSAGGEDFDCWEEEMKVLLNRLSVNGWVKIRLGDVSYMDEEYDDLLRG